MRDKVHRWLTLVMVFASCLSCWASKPKIEVDTGECGGVAASGVKDSKSAIFRDGVHHIRADGLVSYRYNNADEKLNQCVVKYHLFVSNHGQAFVEVKWVAWQTEPGEIAGIDLVGTSADGSKFAADFWLAEGDSEERRPVVFDVNTNKAVYRPLGSSIKKHLGRCSQVEDFIGVTNAGEAIFAIPPSDYTDPPECGDQGVWYFNLQIGKVRQVKKISGDKWDE